MITSRFWISPSVRIIGETLECQFAVARTSELQLVYPHFFKILNKLALTIPLASLTSHIHLFHFSNLSFSFCHLSGAPTSRFDLAPTLLNQNQYLLPLLLDEEYITCQVCHHQHPVHLFASSIAQSSSAGGHQGHSPSQTPPTTRLLDYPHRH